MPRVNFTIHTEGGLTYLETTCVGSCPRPYRIDTSHQDFELVKERLHAGDRSVISCYHKYMAATPMRS